MTWYRIAADTVFALHGIVLLVVIFGWLFPALWYWYMAVLILTLISEFTFGYCILSKWEFVLQHKSDPTVEYDYRFASYYTYRLTKGYLSNRFLSIAGNTFLIASLVINLYFKFLY